MSEISENSYFTATPKKYMLKCLILGNTGVGKTCLMTRYVNNIFTDSYKATIGADFLTKNIEIESNDNKTKSVTLQIWDTAGQERFQSLGVAFYRGSDACVIVFDITEPSSFTSLGKWYQDFIKQGSINEPENFPIMVVGNKADKKQRRRVSEGRAKQWCLDHNMEYVETSALDGYNVENVFKNIGKKALENMENKKKNIFIPPIINLTEEESWKDNICC